MSDEKKQFSGRDLAEALAAARQYFGVSRQEIGFEILSTQKIGQINAAPRIDIRAWANPGGGGSPAAVEQPGREYRDRRGGRREGHESRGPRERSPRRRSEDDFPEFVRFEPEAMAALLPPADVTDPKAILGQLAAHLVGGLELGLEVTSVEETAAGLRVNLDGEDVPLLLEAEGEGLEALQYLINRILQKDGRIENRVSVDAGRFRADAEARLVAEALAVAEEVRKTGQARKMPSMGPYERRLVHMALGEIEGVKTFSTGSGYHRRLHIAPVDADSEAAEENGGANDPGMESEV